MSDERLAEIHAEMEKWESKNKDSFNKEQKSEFLSDAGIPMKRLYTPVDLEKRGFDYMDDLGFPGEFPFTRGIDPSMYRKEIPKFRQYSGFATPEETNTFKNLIEQGQTGFSIAFDLPSQLGHDSDDLRAHGRLENRFGDQFVERLGKASRELTFPISLSIRWLTHRLSLSSPCFFVSLKKRARTETIERKSAK
jgi:hypothetical protein